MAKEFNIVDFIISQTTPAKFDGGGDVQGMYNAVNNMYGGDAATGTFSQATQSDFDAAKVLADYSASLNPYGSDPDFYTNNMADAAARAAAAIAGGTSNVGGFGGDTNAWDMVPEAGGKGSVNDQVNKQGIIDAYLAELDLLTNNLTDMDTSVIDANAAEAMAALPPLTPAETQAKANADAAEIAAGDDDRNIIQKIGTKVGGVFDSIFETLGLPNPTQAIASIFDKTGTFVWGPPSGSPVISTGTTPGGTQTGTTTGNAALDAVLNKVLGVVVGRIEAGEAISPATAKEILVATAADETGMTTEEVDALIDASKNTADAVTSLDDAVGTDLDVVLGDANSDTDAKADNVFGDGNADTKTETDTVVDPPKTPPPVVDESVDPPKTPPPLPLPTSSPPPAEGGGFTGSLPMGSQVTSPGDLVDIQYFYDLFGDSIFAPRVEETDNGLKKGGPVNKRNAVDAVMEILSGRSPMGFAEGEQVPAATPRRAGEYGRRYFSDPVYTATGRDVAGNSLVADAVNIPGYTFSRSQTTAPRRDDSGILELAQTESGLDILLGLYGGEELLARGGAVGGNGYYLGGPTDGMADQVPAIIDNNQPAALSDGEYVVPADAVAHLGNGNSEAGADFLTSTIANLRKDRTGNSKQGRQIDPTKYLS